jgi:hypothetical protein
MVLTDANGVATNLFTVTMQPGDNFRVVASCDPNFASQYYAQQNSTEGAIVKLDGISEVPVSENNVTPMLTVWRHLWIEQDYMREVPLVYRDVLAHVKKGNVFGIGPFVVGPHEFTADFILYGPQYGIGAPVKDEFEGGTLTFSLFDSSQHLITSFDTGEGGQRFIILKSPAWSAVTKKFQFWPPLTTTQLDRMKSNDVSYIHAYFTDDDDYTLFDSPHLLDIGAVGRLAYAEAYILASDAPASWNAHPSLDWIRHLSLSQFLFTLDNRRDLPSTSDFWSTQVVACNEPSRFFLPWEGYVSDYDPDGLIDLVPPYSPFPGSGSTVSGSPLFGMSGGLGTNPGKNLSAIFLQVVHDYWQPSYFTFPRVVDEEHTATHEVAHTGGDSIDHYNDVYNLMHEKPSVQQASSGFAPSVLNSLRGTVTW